MVKRTTVCGARKRKIQRGSKGKRSGGAREYFIGKFPKIGMWSQRTKVGSIPARPFYFTVVAERHVGRSRLGTQPPISTE